MPSLSQQNITLRGDSWLAKILRDIEMMLILEAVGECKGNKSQAARMLGISRPTIFERYKAYNDRLALEAIEYDRKLAIASRR